MHGIEAQTIEAKLVQPINCILDEETAHLRLTEIDRRAPWRVF